VSGIGRARPWVIPVVVVIVAGVLAGVVALAMWDGTRASRTGPAPGGRGRAGSGAGAGVGVGAGIVRVDPGLTLIAMLSRDVPRYAAPGGARAGTVPGSWQGAPASLPVIDQRPGWLRVRLATRPKRPGEWAEPPVAEGGRLAQRPGGDSAWIVRSDAVLVTSSYRIVIDTSRHRLQLYDRGQQVMDAPAGVGTDAFPTPTGRYFLALFAAPPSPDYGAFVVVTSAHSDTTTDWEASGDAMVAIQGPLGGDAEIGSSGAQVSRGCIRLHEPDLERLRIVPAGSPIDIVAGDT